MLRIKSAQWGSQNDFTNVDVRRIHGIVAEFESWSRIANEKMKKLLDDGRYNVSLQEVQELIGYELGQLGLNV